MPAMRGAAARGAALPGAVMGAQLRTDGRTDGRSGAAGRSSRVAPRTDPHVSLRGSGVCASGGSASPRRHRPPPRRKRRCGVRRLRPSGAVRDCASASASAPPTAPPTARTGRPRCRSSSAPPGGAARGDVPTRRACVRACVWRAAAPYPARGGGGGAEREGAMAGAAAAGGPGGGGPGPVAQGLKEALVETLTGILCPVQAVRAAAEEQVKVLEVTEGE